MPAAMAANAKRKAAATSAPAGSLTEKIFPAASNDISAEKEKIAKSNQTLPALSIQRRSSVPRIVSVRRATYESPVIEKHRRSHIAPASRCGRASFSLPNI